MSFTPEQLQQYARFERVRKSGRFNMWAPQAAAAARLTPEEQVFVIDNFEALQVQYLAQSETETS